MFIVEGKKMFQEALQSGWPIEAIIVQETLADAFLPLLAAGELPAYLASDSDFRQLAQLTSPEGILTVIHFPAADFGAIAGKTLPAGPGFLLDAVQDPGNLGAIMRIADWFGFSALICNKGTVDFLNVKSLRSSMGAIFRVQVVYVDSLTSCIDSLDQTVWVADMAGEALGELAMGPADFILLGNEANGVTEGIAESGLRKVHIPGRGGAESLNVSVAAGILAWELSRHTNP